MTNTFDSDAVEAALSTDPIISGRSKSLHRLTEDEAVARLIPTLSSFTFERHEVVGGTAELRLDFYEEAVSVLNAAGVRTAFKHRSGPDHYVTTVCREMPFEVIVKNRAVGSTTRKYPGLFDEDHEFDIPIVKFDYRIDPEDQPIASDYVREWGVDPDACRAIVQAANAALRAWLAPRVLVDICFILGTHPDGHLCITSEVSPDCMRLRSETGESLDKDLFRQGLSHAEIVDVWTELVESLR